MTDSKKRPTLTDDNMKTTAVNRRSLLSRTGIGAAALVVGLVAAAGTAQAGDTADTYDDDKNDRRKSTDSD